MDRYVSIYQDFVCSIKHITYRREILNTCCKSVLSSLHTKLLDEAAKLILWQVPLGKTDAPLTYSWIILFFAFLNCVISVVREILPFQETEAFNLDATGTLARS